MNTTAAASISAESVPQRALIQLEGLTRVFETTEVETHAISDVSLVVRAIGFIFQSFNLIGDLASR